VLGRSEAADLARLTALAGRILHAPVAYVALVQPEGQATCRIGAGTEYSELIEALPAAQNPASPVVVQDLPDDFEDLNFVAMAPVETLCRKRLGMLVIADRAARPAFTAPDLENLADLASVFADRIEMRMIAAQAVITKSLYREVISPNLLQPEAFSACPEGEALQWA
jgi:hypothetical protein